MKSVHCECGEITGVRCEWSGSVDSTVKVRWVPPFLRGAGVAPRDIGTYLTLESSCYIGLRDGSCDPDDTPEAEWMEVEQ